MSIGIIGVGALGSNATRLLAKSGISATIANSRGPESLSGLVGELGPSIKAGTVGEAASADIVLVAVRWVDLGKALGGLPAWNSRIVIDGTNPVAFLDPNSPDAKDPSNPLAAYGIKAIDLGGKHSGDDADAKAEVRKIIEQTGYFPVDLGMLDVGGPLASLPFGSLAAINLVKI